MVRNLITKTKFAAQKRCVFSLYTASKYTFLFHQDRGKHSNFEHYFNLEVTSNAESIFISLLFHGKHPSYDTSNRGKRQ